MEIFKKVQIHYKRFIKTGAILHIPTNKRMFLKYAFLRKIYRVSIDDFYTYRFYDKSLSHEDYFSASLRVTRSWKNAWKKYRPESSKRWLLFHYVDYIFSKLLYPGLDGMDYFAYEFYNFSRSKRKTFITEGYLKKMDRKFNLREECMYASEILLDKAKFNEYFSKFISRKWICAKNMTIEEFNSFCKGLEMVIVKPLEECGGHGIYEISIKKNADKEQLYRDLVGRHYILEEKIRQHQDIAALNPHSINTLRVYSCSDGIGNIEITKAVIRVGGG